MVSKNNSSIITVLFLILLLGAMAYLDSFQLRDHSISTFQIGAPVSETDQSVANNVQEETAPIFDLENKLVDTTIEDGYITETYREYEIYKDKNGEIIKIVPTSHYDYLHYKIQ